MLITTGTKEKWELSAQSFDKLLAALDSDREKAGEKYLQIRKNLVRFFEGRGFPDAETHADEVYNRIAKKIEAGETFENIGTYVYGVARFLMLELQRKNIKEDNFLSNQPVCVPAPDIIEEEEKHLQLSCLNSCLRELPDENRSLIVNYYQGEKREKIEIRQRLAENMGIPQNALRNRVVRLRDKLESCITNCLKRTQ